MKYHMGVGTHGNKIIDRVYNIGLFYLIQWSYVMNMNEALNDEVRAKLMAYVWICGGLRNKGNREQEQFFTVRQ